MLQKNVICDLCEGRGCEEGCVQKCQVCRGTGTESRMQQIEQICRNCAGQGEINAAKDRCKQCKGNKTIHYWSKLQVHIEKGMRHGQKIVYYGEGNQEPDMYPGDIVVILEEEAHPVFTRDDNNLIMVMPLFPVDSSCGFQRLIETLDKRVLVVTNLPGDVIKNEDMKCILREGMPLPYNPFERGNLIIQFQIVFPRSVGPELVPQNTEVTIPIYAQHCALVRTYATKTEKIKIT